jgi:chemotaxis protein MotB
MNGVRRAVRGQAAHTNDWLITYADMITLLLCFFVIFYVILSAQKKTQQEVPAARSPAHLTQLSGQASAPFGLEKIVPVQTMPVQTVTGNDASGATRPDSPDKPDNMAAGKRITAVEMAGSELFDSGSATLKEDGKVIVQGVAAQLQSAGYDGYRIVVEGHTDDTPISSQQFASNWELSMARAAAVVHFLLNQGIPADRLRATGYGDTDPKLPNRDVSGNPIPDNQAQNRRVVIKLEKVETEE